MRNVFKHTSYITMVSLILPMLLALGCEKTVEDVRAWSRDRRYERKMKEFILGDNTEEVKVESIVVLIERNKAVNLDPILSDLPEDERFRLISKVIPRIEEMSAKDNQGLKLLAKDGAYWLTQLEPPPPEDEMARLKKIMLTWIDNPRYFWNPPERIGTVERKQIFEVLGADGLPVIERQMTQRLDKLDKAKADQLPRLGKDINDVLLLARSLNLPETDERMAAIMVTKMEQLYPNIPLVLAKVFEKNKSEKLLGLARRIATDNTYTSSDTDGSGVPDLLEIKDFIIKEYYVDVQPKEGIKACREVLRRSTEGYYRWDCARTLVINAKDKGLEYFFEDLPDNPQKLLIPKDHFLVAAFELDPNTFHWSEISRFCTWAQTNEASPTKGAFPLDIARKKLASEKLMDKVVGMHCLAAIGETVDANAIKALADDKDIAKMTFEGEGWGFEEATLGELATRIASEIESGELNAPPE